MRINILIILFICYQYEMQSQPLSSDGNYTNLKIGIINCKDTLNFVQYKDYKIISLNNKFIIDIVVLKDGEEISYNENSGARSIDYIDNSKHQYFVTRYNSKENYLKIIITKKKKKMIIIYKIKKHRDYLPWNIQMFLYFKKGTYEVTDPENPKLVKIKMKKIEYGL